MAKRMLIDAAHPEETRVVVTSGNRLEEFDFESSTKKQVKGNIYLAKVTRVEPSLQAAFVDYGGNRHGFLAFSEIHPDYYRIPVGDRQGSADAEMVANGHAETEAHDDEAVPIAAALPEQVLIPEAANGDDDASEESGAAEQDAAPAGDSRFAYAEWGEVVEPQTVAEPAAARPEPAGSEAHVEPAEERAAIESAEEPAPAVEPASKEAHDAEHTPTASRDDGPFFVAAAEPHETAPTATGEPETRAEAMALRSADEAVVSLEVDQFPAPETPSGGASETPETAEPGHPHDHDDEASEVPLTYGEHAAFNGHADAEFAEREHGEAEVVETFGGDEVEEVEEADAERRRYQPTRHYKIQEVIKRRQIMLVQVAKEERGNKGAALTTYLSLAGRYCVLMPNTNRGGGVSRKITSIADRRRLKDILEELDIPEGMGVIVRTAGAERSKAEIKRDYEYLLRLWNEIRDLTLQSTAPALIYEEGNLIKRSIRDLYARDIDDVLVEGEEGYKVAKAFMRTLMPSHAKRVQPYRDPQIGLFHRFQIESQIDAIHSPIAQLKSGGYIVINQTEALVSIDVNSGRSTRERNIEETALRTNLEAAEEIARQLRLRDLAGLIVIDFIDMEEHRNQVAVERRLKDALRNDRARIQVGRISPFGLLEMSRQRLRPSLAETSTQPCPHCGGTGFIRSVESTALYVLRSIEEEGIRRRSAEICIYLPTNVALYILNQKRESLGQIEARYALRVMVARDDTLIPPNFRLERTRQYGVGEVPALPTIQAPILPEVADEEEEDEALVEAVETDAEVDGAAEAEGDDERGRRRRRRRRRRPDEGREPRTAAPEGEDAGETAERSVAEEEKPPRDGDSERRHRRRGRRGRIRTPRRDGAVESDEAAEAAEGAPAEHAAAETIEVVPDQPVETNHEVERHDWAFAEPSAIADVEEAVETASLAPLVGETIEPVAPHPEPAAVGADAEPVPTAEAEQGVPFTSEPEKAFEQAHSEQAHGELAHGELAHGELAHGELAHGELAAAPPAPEPPPLEPAEELPPPAPVGRPNEDVLTVTEKPANPRRGWWQRLMNP